jgi:hypothetical protein
MQNIFRKIILFNFYINLNNIPFSKNMELNIMQSYYKYIYFKLFIIFDNA